MDPTIQMWIAAGIILVGNGGLAYMGVKRGINGLSENIKLLGKGQAEIKTDIKEMRLDVHGLDTRVSVIETKIN